MRHVLSFLIVFSVLISSANASHESVVDKILSEKETPGGIVIEIVSRQNQFLDWALPEAQKQAKRIREKFPGLDIAIVTHGREQFALMANKKAEKMVVHSLVE
ncbi:MAG: hypothetical protein OEX07_07945, partial [Gammaproteobacteria bacterium]|nr:hypothetical protein [Gammaproteobacteria bacterium]